MGIVGKSQNTQHTLQWGWMVSVGMGVETSMQAFSAFDIQKPIAGFFIPTVRTTLNLLVACVLLAPLFPPGTRAA